MTPDDLPDLRNALIMLDFDGTLVDLAATPDAIRVPQELRDDLNTLNAVSRGVTLITGRALDDLTTYLPDFEGDIYGSHGGECRVSGAYKQPARITARELDQLWAAADEIAATDPALIAERKPAGVVVHYRQAPALESRIQDAMAAVVAGLNGLSLHPSKMAVEVRPDGVSKADAARTIIATAQVPSVPVFAGDDVTDEDAMQAVNAEGGVTIKIGQGPTCAAHRLATPNALRDLLQNWQRETRT